MNLCLIAHPWVERTFTGRGTVGGYRYCAKCYKEQTRLFDYAAQEYRWVDGRFTSTLEHYFMFSNSASFYHEKKKEMFSQYNGVGDIKFTWVEFPSTFEYMAKVRDPMLALAKDYADMDLIRDYRFARLFEIGHLLPETETHMDNYSNNQAAKGFCFAVILFVAFGMFLGYMAYSHFTHRISYGQEIGMCQPNGWFLDRDLKCSEVNV